jgi:hypothetical protein
VRRLHRSSSFAAATQTYRGYVVGTMTRPIFEDIAAGAQYLGIRFAAGGFTHLFGCPAHEFTDQTVPLDSLPRSSVSADQIAGVPEGRLCMLRTA